MHIDTRTVDSYSFAEFCKMIQELIKEGFEFDFDSNENYPTTFGSYYHVIMVKKDVEVKQFSEEVVTEAPVTEEVAVSEPEVKAKPGRKPKSA